VNWLVVWALAVALNAVPAFMPPTWSVLAYFHLYHGLPVVPLAIVGALGATTGRTVLAVGSRAFGDRFVPASWRENVEALVTTLQSRPALALPSLALFALGPVPSNHLFVAAGLARVPLRPILVVFASARFVSYVLWVSAANVADRSLRDVFGSRVAGWGAIALQIAGFALIVLAMRIDWHRLLQRRTRDKSKSE
jgi:membrane protein YqaA with SNARE-associated domain